MPPPPQALGLRKNPQTLRKLKTCVDRLARVLTKYFIPAGEDPWLYSRYENENFVTFLAILCSKEQRRGMTFKLLRCESGSSRTDQDPDT